MTRTRSEVKLGLTACQDTMCDECPYQQDTRSYDELIRDALEYIMELEAEVRELKGGTSDRGIATPVCELARNGQAEVRELKAGTSDRGIATPVCELARNGRLNDGKRKEE